MKDQKRGSLILDEIRIDNLKVFANHGVLQSEKKTGQFFYINAVIELP